jgi:1-deoxy-D-xylulose-5-phosphate synthase
VVVILGIPDEVIEHGTPKDLHKQAGYDATAIVRAVKHLMKDEVVVGSLG